MSLKLNCSLKKQLWLSLFSVLVSPVFAGDRIDSLYKLLKTEGQDSTRAHTLMMLSHELFLDKPDSSVAISKRALLLSEKINYNYGIGYASNQLADYFQKTSAFDSALVYAERALIYFNKTGSKLELSRANYTKGIINATRGKLIDAERSFILSRKYASSAGSKDEEADAIIALSIVAGQTNQLEKKISYLNEALQIKSAENDSEGIASCYANIGNTYLQREQFKEGIKYYKQAEKYVLNNKNPFYLRNIYSNTGICYKEMKDYENAVLYMLKGIRLTEEMKDKDGLIISYNELGDLFIQLKDFKKALQYIDLAFKISIEMKNNQQLLISYQYYSKIYEGEGDYKKALVYALKYADYKDTIFTREASKQVSEMNAKYESDEKDKEIRIKNLEAGQKDEQISNQKKFSLFISIGLALTLALVFFIFRSFKQKQRANLLLEAQKKEIAHQKELVDEKNTEILDSIHYAQKIQHAILPGLEEAEKYLGESFILFRPKDIVSGDFYWIAQKEEYIFYAAADCTGHGVPGGFMSMLGTALLNEVVNEKKIYEPADILDMLRVKIILALKQKGLSGENKDGMDMCLVRLNKKKNELVYAAANNSLYIVRDKLITDHKGDKQPVGISGAEIKQFTQRIIPLQKGDCIYTFTDGYADQFGGPKGKKFKYKQLEELLTENSSLSLPEQKILLENKFLDWKGEFEQVDDVCVIGLRV